MISWAMAPPMGGKNPSAARIIPITLSAHSTDGRLQRNMAHVLSNMDQFVHPAERGLEHDCIGSFGCNIALHPKRDTYSRGLHGRRVVNAVS